MIKFRFSSLAFLTISALCLFYPQSSAQSAQEVPPIRYFLQVNEQFCTGGQPRLEHLAKLKADGVKVIINLRQPSEHRAPEEEAEATKLGLRYFNIVVVYAETKDEQDDDFINTTDHHDNRPAIIHSAATMRGAAFWMMRG